MQLADEFFFSPFRWQSGISGFDSELPELFPHEGFGLRFFMLAVRHGAYSSGVSEGLKRSGAMTAQRSEAIRSVWALEPARRTAPVRKFSRQYCRPTCR